MDKIKLTPKQEKFCQVYIETGNASEAYRQAYNASRTKPEVVAVKASQMLANGKIAVRIDALRALHQKRHEITVDDLVAELEEARKLAFETDKAAAAVQAWRTSHKPLRSLRSLLAPTALSITQALSLWSTRTCWVAMPSRQALPTGWTCSIAA